MTTAKPIASLSLDLDNLWCYLKNHGHPQWQELPTYLPLFVPRVLGLLDRLGLRITFFLVGQDCERDENREALRAIAAAGHEVASHSYYHDTALGLQPEDEVEAELARAEDAIVSATGMRPIGFRGPGFAMSPATLRVLARRGYRYDASTWPNFIGPLAGMYYARTSNLPPEEKAKRAKLFGKLSDGLRPLKPYRWQTGCGELIELPVTTAPVVKLPMHVTYLMFLGAYSGAAARAYFRTALTACRLARVAPSVLLHPTDFLTADDVPEMAFFPAMKMPTARKLQLAEDFLVALAQRFRVVPMREHAEHAAQQRLALLRPAA
jgi:peptidoglycan/xylan/chitin deacetylase (PgdA/CDA1 family)